MQIIKFNSDALHGLTLVMHNLNGNLHVICMHSQACPLDAVAAVYS